MRNALSDSFGRLFFKELKPGEYELTEVSAPAGYQPDPAIHKVSVDLNGNATIEGRPADGYRFYNMPAGIGRLIFVNADAGTGLPLAGAVFSLSNGLTATSDASGTIDLGFLQPGTYSLRETAAPEGYTPVFTDYTVSVSKTGAVTVAGIPLPDFYSVNKWAQDQIMA